MARTPSLISRIRDLIAPKQKIDPLGQVQHTSTARTRRIRSLHLPVSEPMVRLILGDKDLTRDLLEIMEWSPEAIGAVGVLSGDTFQQIDGQTSSWSIAATRDGLENGANTHPDVIAIAQEIRGRFSGKQYVIGGDRLQTVHANQLWLGDGYAEIELSKDGKSEYFVSQLLDRPSLQIFHSCENGKISNYQLRTGHGPDDEAFEIPWWKMLHLSHGGCQGRYGKPLLQSQIDAAWRPLKATAEDMLDVIRANGTAPWIHEYGQETTEQAKEVYQLQLEQERETRILTDLFIDHGGSVTRASGGDGAISAILEAAIHYRTLMIPPGIPAWMFSGLKSGDAAKELANQPALAYARRQGSYRSQIGAQIKWVIALEIVLRKSYDFYAKEGQFEIEWPKWFISGLEADLMSQAPAQAPPQGQQVEERINRMMAQLDKRQGHLMSLSNVGRVIEEVEKANGPI